MRHILIFTGLSIFILTSCYREPEPNPYADFGVDYVYVEPNEVVFFNNYSKDADYYEWDFGDGYGSNAFQPSHTYSSEGVYKVTLAAYNSGIVDYTYLEIEVYETTLEVEVIEWRTDDVVNYIAGIEVAIFDNYDSWYYYPDTYTGYNARGNTNSDGTIAFVGVRDIPYYIDVFSPSFNNMDLADDDINFVLTAALQHARHNIFTAYVDYKPQGKAVLRAKRSSLKSAGDKPKRSAKNLNRIKEKN
jgi:hypothetical protein